MKNLEKNNPDKTTLIHINQYSTDKQNLERKKWFSGYNCSECKNQRISNKIHDHAKYITTQKCNKSTRENFENLVS